MRKPEQNRENYGTNPGRGSRLNESYRGDWTNTNEQFSTDHDNNYEPNSGFEANTNANSGSHYTTEKGWDRSGLRSSNPGLRGPHYGKGPKGYRRSDDRVKEDVCEMLYAHHEIDASEIEVLVEEGTVTLSGMVESRNLKRQVESAIDGISGVEDVQNNLKVMKNNSPMSGAKDIGDVKSLRS